MTDTVNYVTQDLGQVAALTARVGVLDDNVTALITAVTATKVGLQTSVANAATNATLAGTKATAADASATAAGVSAGLSGTYAENSRLHMVDSEASSVVATTKAAAAAASASSLAVALASFRQFYLGTFASDPLHDGNGDALQEGAEYFNSVSDKLRTYTGGVWVDYDSTAQAATNNANLSAAAAATSEAAAAAALVSVNGMAVTVAGYTATSAGDAATATEQAAIAVENGTIATTQAVSAALQASNAATSATDSASSATTATTKASEAATSATTASTKAAEAATSATSASTKAAEAATSATSASASAATATTQAEALVTAGTIATTQAAIAMTQAALATTQAEDAAASAASAAANAGDVNAGVTEATAQGTAAAANAALALEAKASALASAATATTKAADLTTAVSTATTKASEASSSATTAGTGATTATTKAAEAVTSATSAATSAATATTQAALAVTSAGTASTDATTAFSSKTTAVSSAAAAAASASAAAADASTASTKATSATGSATTATTQAGIATTKAAEAAASATAVATNTATVASNLSTVNSQTTTTTTKAAEASTSATNAAASATTASTGATTATTQAGIATTQAGLAAASAGTAATSATTATTGASTVASAVTAASGSATAAAGSATSASTSATSAGTSATSATADAATATTKAATATTQAGIATTKASEASASAATAYGASLLAVSKADEASTSATSAATSLAAIGSSEANAATSATSAATSATYADTSAATATTKATLATEKATVASSSATTATDAAASAGSQATYAAVSAASALTSASSATASQAVATTQKELAQTAATTATAQAVLAANSASAAAGSATGAAASDASAQDWAEKTPNIPVETGMYSAKHWAMQAQASSSGSVTYRGMLDASIGSYPSLAHLGDYYVIGTAGTIGGTYYTVGESIIYNGTTWDSTGGATILSVNGEVGTVVLTKTHIGLSNVDNTSDANKPVSTAQATAIALKATASSLATVATTGAYGDLSGTPTAYSLPLAGSTTLGGIKSSSSVLVDGSTGVATVTPTSIGARPSSYVPAWSEVTSKPTTLAGYNISDAYPLTGNPAGYSTTVGTVTGVTATGPVLSSGGTAPVISLPAATSSVSGYLSSTDWATFNAKAPVNNPTFTGTVGGVTAAMVGAPSGSGSSSGTNTGDNATNTQYSGLVTNATHTGDVTGSGALTIATSAVTLAKMADMATGSLIYRKTAATGVPEVNTLATLKTDLGLTGTNSGDNSANTLYSSLVTNATHTGDVTGATALTIATSAVTLAKMADMATASLIYRKTAATGAPEVNTLATLKTDLGLTGTNSGDNSANTLYSGLVTNATHTGDVTGSGALTIANSAVTLAKMADMATGSLIYRKTAATGAPEVNTLATLKTDLGLTGTNSGDNSANTLYSGLVTNATHTGDVTGSGALTIANKVTMTATAPVLVSGSPTVIAGGAVAISMAAATTSVPGYLTAADWTTFNGKQAALGFTPMNSTVPVVQYTGTAGDMNAFGVHTINEVTYANDSTSNLPVSPSGSAQWWNTLTMGPTTRTTQIAAQAYGTGSGNAPQSDVWIRSKHDAGWSTWLKFITSGNIASQSVNYATTAGSAPANGGTSAACSGNAASATYASGVTPNSFAGAGTFNLSWSSNGGGDKASYYTPALTWTPTTSMIGGANISGNAATATTAAACSGEAARAKGLQRSDSPSDAYNVQSWWDGAYWELKGYASTTYHAGCKVAYATTSGACSGNAATATTATALTGHSAGYAYADGGNSATVGGYGRCTALADYTTWDSGKCGPVGWYNFAGGPTTSNFHMGWRTTFNEAMTYGAEIAVVSGGGRAFFRTFNANVGQAWNEFYHNGNLTLSQTAGTSYRAVQADVNGYIHNTYFNSTDNAIASGVTAIMAKQGNDFMRSASAAAVATFISGQAMNISGASTSCSGNAASASQLVGAAPNGVYRYTPNVHFNSGAGGGIYINWDNGGTGTHFHVGNGFNSEAFSVSSTGVTWAASTISSASDERLKKNWRDLGIDYISKLAKVKYGVYDRTDIEQTQVGVSAQSLQEVMPEAVTASEDGMLAVAYGNAALAACVALAKEVTELRAEINKLKGI